MRKRGNIKKEKKKKKHRESNKNDKTEQLTDILTDSIPHIATSASSIISTPNEKQNKFESILRSLSKFESNTHSLSHLLSDSAVIPEDMLQCKLLIKILFEQLWNARKLCDEQILYIKYINMIDAGNRMQISFILNQLKEKHINIYNDLYQKIQLNPNWKNWKNLRFHDKKINDLRQNIQKIKQNQQILTNKNNKDYSRNIQDIQLNTIYNLENQQSAHIQKFDLSLNQKSNKIENDSFFTNYEKKMRSEFDLSKALKSVDSINAPTHKAPKPDIVDLVDTKDEDDVAWMVTIKKLLKEFSATMDLTEINDKLESLRYCSEFDVLNDLLMMKVNNAQEIKLRFCYYFGNLSEWSFKRLIKWCQTYKFYTICKKIRSNKINGKEFIDIVTNITSVRRFFNNLTSPQIIQLYNRINKYFEDALSIF